MHRALGRLRCSSCIINATRQQYSTAPLGEAPRLSYAPIRAPLQRYNALISRLADKGDLVRALQLAQELKRNLIETGQKPDLTTYEVLAKAFAVHGLSREALHLVDDAKAEGINPDIGVWNQVLRAHIAADQSLTPVVEALRSEGIKPKTLTRQLIVDYYVQKRSLEPAVRALIDMATVVPSSASTSSIHYSENNLNFFKVPRQTFDTVMRLVCDMGETKLALGLLASHERSAQRPVSTSVLYDMVSAGITHDDPSCAWKGIEGMTSLGHNLSEGLAVPAMNLFARHALVDACETVYNAHVVPHAGDASTIQEWHVAPLVAVNLATGRLEESLRRFNELCKLSLRKSVPARPSYRLFHAGLRHLSVVQHTLEQLGNIIEYRSEPIPIQLINGLLKACGQHQLFQEQKTLADHVLLGSPKYPAPDSATFEILVQGCLIGHRSAPHATSDVVAAEDVLHTMRTNHRKLKATQNLYEALVQVYLQADQEEWEKAFDYLEEMKYFNYMPKAQLYVKFLDRLLANESSGEDESSRIDLILQEMASLGYLGGKRRDYVRTKLPNKYYDLLGRERVMKIRDRFYASE